MLVLSRKQNESIVIGDSIIKITRVSGNRVTVAIEAPKHVKIIRGELVNVADSECQGESHGDGDAICNEHSVGECERLVCSQ